MKTQYRNIEEILKSFGVRAKIVGHSTGPNVITYHVQPEASQPVKALFGLEADLALRLAAISVRIVRKPGKPFLGLEVPNPHRDTVKLSGLNPGRNLTLPLVLGISPEGKMVTADLTKMPHLLVAGATGSGKSVALHTMIVSMIKALDPDRLRFVMIDPKQVELAHYANLPHMLREPVTGVEEAIDVLEWLTEEMELRLDAMHSQSVRNIEAYNDKVTDYTFPRIVVVIDELADLMLIGKREIEDPLVRLAQKSRAVGIHLIVATQRPSSQIITGLIKANFPARVAMRVASKVDSRVILDANGAEALLGNGDMLFTTGGPTLQRVQGAFVSTDEIETIVSDQCHTYHSYNSGTELTTSKGQDESSTHVGLVRAAFDSAMRLSWLLIVSLWSFFINWLLPENVRASYRKSWQLFRNDQAENGTSTNETN